MSVRVVESNDDDARSSSRLLVLDSDVAELLQEFEGVSEFPCRDVPAEDQLANVGQ